MQSIRLFYGNLTAFKAVISILWKNRHLTYVLAKREISDRYVGQAFGMVWAFGHPLFMMGLFVFIFAVVFKTKVGGTLEMPLDYITYLLSGLVAWMGFQESLVKSSIAITSNSSLVKQVVFPLEILPVKGVLASLFQQGILLLSLVAYVLIRYGTLPWTYVLLPVLIGLQLVLMIGVAFLLSAVGAYFRDLKDFVQLFAVSGIYLLPVVYLPDWVPPVFKPILFANPLSHMIWCYQDVLYFGRIEHPWAWVVNVVFSFLMFILGYRVFNKLKLMFGNVL